MQYPGSIKKLIEHFSKLPTVGPKTAERYVFYLLKNNQNYLNDFSTAIADLKKNIKICKICLSVSETDPCEICSDQTRDSSKLCVVANTRNMISVEATREFRGYYHVLGGLINAIDDIGPEQLKTKELLDKIKTNKIQEVLIALNPNIEGETTTLYLLKILKPLNIQCSKLAQGLPMGSDLEYADERTLGNALKFRNKL